MEFLGDSSSCCPWPRCQYSNRDHHKESGVSWSLLSALSCFKKKKKNENLRSLNSFHVRSENWKVLMAALKNLYFFYPQDQYCWKENTEFNFLIGRIHSHSKSPLKDMMLEVRGKRGASVCTWTKRRILKTQVILSLFSQCKKLALLWSGEPSLA